MLSLGIDSGSSTTKGVLLDHNKILDKIIFPTGANPKQTIRHIYNTLKKDYTVYTVTTGYGRELLETADKRITEITCHGKGAAFLQPDINAVIDIGGQDSKVILLDRDKNIKDFLMNDKCAAGTGRFVEVILRILQQDFSDLDSYVLNFQPIKISSMCTVFAESEVISLLAQDISPNAIAKGVISSICERTAAFAKRLPLDGSIFFSGGLAQSHAISLELQEKLGLKVVTHELAQYAGAIGAAVIGMKKIKKF